MFVCFYWEETYPSTDREWPGASQRRIVSWTSVEHKWSGSRTSFCCPRKITWDIYPVSTALASKKPSNGHQGCSLWMTGRCVFWNYGRATSCRCLPFASNGYKNRHLVNTCQIVTTLTTVEFLASRSTSEA